MIGRVFLDNFILKNIISINRPPASNPLKQFVSENRFLRELIINISLSRDFELSVMRMDVVGTLCFC